MRFLKYVEARFVQSQIQINNKTALTATDALAENHAVRAIMWITLKVCTLFEMVYFPFHYLCVILHISQAPRNAVDQVLEEQNKMKTKNEQDSRIAAIAASVAKDGLSAVPNS